MRAQIAVNSAMEHFHAGRAEDAKRVLRQFLQRQPNDPNVNKLLAMIHGALHEDAAALIHIARAAAADPADVELAFMHGNTLFLMQKFDDAQRVLRKCLSLAPAHAASVDVLSKILLTRGRDEEALELYRAASAHDPGQARLYADAARILQEVGRTDEAAAFLRRGVSRCPEDVGLLSQACYSLNFCDVDALEHFEFHRRFGTALTRDASPAAAPFANSRDPERELRVAFLSSDFRDHACGTFMMPLVRRLGSHRVRLHLYSCTETPDAWTQRFQACGEWRDLAGLDAGALADLARRDAIDVLVECNGLTAGTRLGMLTPRIAPVQCTWLGYPHTTGVPALDWRIVDAATDPPGSESACLERLARLPGCFLCYEPQESDPPPTLTRALEPGGEHEPITFGSFNRMSKISPRTARVWAEVLRRVPNSRLLLKARVQSDAIRAAYTALFQRHAVDPARIHFSEFAPHHHEHLTKYNQIDVALDTFPYNGTTTTCEALWMGVPVVVLQGDSHRARVGASLLRAAGMSDWIARNEEEFISLAVRAAEDRQSLRATYLALRERLRASPLLDADAYSKRFAEMLRSLWHDGCVRT